MEHKKNSSKNNKEQKIKILIVEDESIAALDLQEQLSDLNYSPVGIAITGEEAIKMALAEKPNLIIMDIMLKGKMTGIEAAEQIRKSYDIPIIYRTAYSDEKTFSKALKTGPSSYIVKTMDNPQHLKKTIELALFNHQAQLKTKQEIQTKLEESNKKLFTSETQVNQIKHLLNVESVQKEGKNPISIKQTYNIDYSKLIINEQLPKWFSALGNHDRFKIIQTLHKNPCKIKDLEILLDKARTTINHHLSILEKNDIIEGKITGKFIHFSLTKKMDSIFNSFNIEDDIRNFEALSNTDRLAILNLLITHPSNIPELEALINKSQASVSHHLKLLEVTGLISVRKKGRNNDYLVEKQKLDKILYYYEQWISV